MKTKWARTRVTARANRLLPDTTDTLVGSWHAVTDRASARSLCGKSLGEGNNNLQHRSSTPPAGDRVCPDCELAVSAHPATAEVTA